MFGLNNPRRSCQNHLLAEWKINLPAPTARINRLTMKGPVAFPAFKTLGRAPKIMMIWAMKQTKTPMRMVLKRPRRVSAIHAPKMGMT